MRFSLSNTLLLVALFATGLGWYTDHRQLQLSNARLNAEATMLFDKYWVSTHSGGTMITSVTGGKSVYLHSNAEDRAELLRSAEQPWFLGQGSVQASSAERQ